ncbi:MAG: AraC family transcriptional regulator [Aphanocapsa sp. GSE-SYN-MK-11-07L]|jgi:AraC-like DNA-binding protein|nr:AraC family transcriptional regulator [Aphanocapsa sp. GSE-SYN-MK-11-07L]
MLTLTPSDYLELYSTVEWECTNISSSNYWEETCQQPALLGQGHLQIIGLCGDELTLFLSTWESRHAYVFKYPEREHEVEICLELPACRTQQDGRYTLFGSGIALQSAEEVLAGGRCMSLSASFEPDLLKTLYGDDFGQLPPELQVLIQPNDWQFCRPDQKVTAEMQRIMRQIFSCPYQGLTKQIYLQAKVFELLALQVELLQTEPERLANPRLKRRTMERIHQAKDILLASLEHPPSILELSQQVGLSDRTLRRGFQHIFGTTVIGFLTDQRLEQAERLLREPDRTVAEVAGLVGYARSSRFAEAFKGKFGITPRECLAGKKSVLQ